MPRLTEEFGRPTFDAKAPLSEWTVYGTLRGLNFPGYETLSECEQMRRFVKDRELKNLPAKDTPPRTTEEGYALTTTFAVCVSSDDPRLRRN